MDVYRPALKALLTDTALAETDVSQYRLIALTYDDGVVRATTGSLMNVLRRVVAEYFDMALPAQDFSDEEREILIDYYKCLCFGIIVDWCEKGMREDYADDFHKLIELRSRMLDAGFGK